MEFTCPFCLSQLEVDDECSGQDAVCPYCGKKIKILKIKILKEGCRPPQDVSENADAPYESHAMTLIRVIIFRTRKAFRTFVNYTIQFLVSLKNRLLLMREKGIVSHADPTKENKEGDNFCHIPESVNFS